MTKPESTKLPCALSIVLCIVLTACGGGGGGGSSNQAPAPAPAPPPAAVETDFEQGIFRDPLLFKDMCAVPRGQGFADVQGSTEDENNWLRAWNHDLYLWYDEIVDADPALYDPLAYFDLMKTLALTPSGAPKDRFHFTFDTETWQQLSQSGVSAGYGAEIVLLSAAPPREAVVAFVEPGSPAANASVTRGTRILTVDGVDLINAASNAEVDTLNAGLFPAATGEMHSFEVEDNDGGNRRLVNMTSAEITEDPVPTARVIATPSGPVGYLLFNTHIATAEARLIDELRNFETAGITQLVVDLRYNGGGFLDIANELAFMIAGPSAASGRTFDELQFNDKHTTTNPVTGQALSPTPFHETSQGFSVAQGAALPSVNLSRVYVLAGPRTCSASETIINSLRGIGVEVILIGAATCGKPYGFYPTDNCGTTYFSIQFRGINHAGFGDYTDGFLPTASPDPTRQWEVRGCVVADDFDHALGDEAEARFATALGYIASNDCSAAPVAASQQSGSKATSLMRLGGALQDPFKMPGAVLR